MKAKSNQVYAVCRNLTCLFLESYRFHLCLYKFNQNEEEVTPEHWALWQASLSPSNPHHQHAVTALPMSQIENWELHFTNSPEKTRFVSKNNVLIRGDPGPRFQKNHSGSLSILQHEVNISIYIYILTGIFNS